MSIIDKNQLWLAIGILSILAASSSSAADKPGKDQSRRLQQQLRLAEQEKAKLNQKIVEAESQLKDIQEKSVSSKRLAEEASGRAARLKSDLDRLRSQAAADKESLTAKLTETERMLAELKLGFSAERQQFESVATRQRTALAACSERNARMYQLGNDLLDKYEEKSCVSAILQAEPFTGLKRAQIEKMIEEERENLDKNVLNPVKTAEVARQDQ